MEPIYKLSKFSYMSPSDWLVISSDTKKSPNTSTNGVHSREEIDSDRVGVQKSERVNPSTECYVFSNKEIRRYKTLGQGARSIDKELTGSSYQKFFSRGWHIFNTGEVIWGVGIILTDKIKSKIKGATDLTGDNLDVI